MIKRKYMLVLALAVCLTTTLFAVTSIGYDPWVDQDEDGDVDSTDLNVLAGEYGSTGDPTKNVSVTNWPEPQMPTFADILVLRGQQHGFLKTSPPSGWEWLGVLVDDNMPNLRNRNVFNFTYLYGSDADPVPTHWDKEADANFTYVPANSQFFIQGEAAIGLTVYYYITSTAPDTIYYNITVHLEKVSSKGTTLLSQDLISINADLDGVSTGTWNQLGGILNIPLPVLVEAGERLRIRFATLVRCDNGFVDSAMITLEHTRGTDEFIAYIPILQP